MKLQYYFFLIKEVIHTFIIVEPYLKDMANNCCSKRQANMTQLFFFSLNLHNYFLVNIFYSYFSGLINVISMYLYFLKFIYEARHLFGRDFHLTRIVDHTIQEIWKLLFCWVRRSFEDQLMETLRYTLTLFAGVILLLLFFFCYLYI